MGYVYIYSTRKTYNQTKWAVKVWKEWANNKLQPDEAPFSCVNAQLLYCPDVTHTWLILACATKSTHE